MHIVISDFLHCVFFTVAVCCVVVHDIVVNNYNNNSNNKYNIILSNIYYQKGYNKEEPNPHIEVIPQ